MQRQFQKKSTQRGVLWRHAVSAILLGMSAALLWNAIRIYDARQEKFAHVRDKIRKVSESMPSLSLTRVNGTLLTDSILSIIQSYYVDPERVENHDLVRMTVESLPSRIPGVRSGKHTNDQYWVEFAGERVDVAVNRGITYEQLVDQLALIGELLDRGFNLQKKTMAPEAKRKVVDTDTYHGVAQVLNTLLDALDAHSTLLSQEAYRELRQGTEGAFGGLGVLVGIRDHLLTVIRPLPRSPAVKAGIKRSDRILDINGTKTFGATLDQLVEHMRGDPGTPVSLSLLRKDAESPEAIVLNREVIHVDSVASAERHDHGMNLLHLTIESFASRTSREVLSAVKKARKRAGGNLDGLILDMRSNPGGLLDQAVQVADLFLKSGVIVSTRGRREEVERAGPGYDEIDFPMIVLVNNDSASASEIVAGALQDHGRAIVVGQPTFGKGSVQTIFELPEERALKLTIARYYTPAGRSIQNVGIIPDVWMQPVFKDGSNENLFGSYRYKNEQFLQNHLKVSGGEQDPEALGRQATFKGYYLLDQIKDDEKQGRDRELEMAVAILRKAKAIRGAKVSLDDNGEEQAIGGARAGHMLGLAGPEISGILSRSGNEVNRWLSKKFQITWKDQTTDGSRNPSDQIVLEIDRSSFPQTVHPGESIKVNWKVTNSGRTPVHRTSFFLRSAQNGIDTKEVLIGSLEPGASISGVANAALPNGFQEDTFTLRAGAAIDAWPLATVAGQNGGDRFDDGLDLVATVIPRQNAKVIAEAQLVDDGNGKINGTLEPREHAQIVVTVQNTGTKDISRLEVTAHNLSGKQLRIGEVQLPVEKLRVGEKRRVAFSVDGNRRILSPILGVGIAVGGEELGDPEFIHLSLPGMVTDPTQRVGH